MAFFLYTFELVPIHAILKSCIKRKVSESALYLRKIGADINLATVDRLKYYVCRYEGSLNGIEDPVVLITYPSDTLHIPKAPRTFISMESS